MGPNQAIILSHSGDEIKTTAVDHVVVSTGHWQEAGPIFTDRKIAAIWPARRFIETFKESVSSVKETPIARVAIKGSSLSAIDALRSLIFSTGGFVRDEQDLLVSFKAPVFKDYEGKAAGLVVDFVSRNALLPKVRGTTGHYQNRYLTASSLEGIASNHDGHIKLVHVWTLLQEDLDAAYGEYGLENPYRDSSAVIDLTTDPFEQLARDLEMAKKGDAPDGTLVWQTVYVQASKTFGIAFQLLHPDDRLAFLKKWRTFHMYHIAPMPPMTAEELLMLHQCGFLGIKSARSPELSNIDLAQKYDVVVEAVGQETLHEDNPHVLHRNIVDSGLMSPSHRLIKPECVDGLDVVGVASLSFGTARASRCVEHGLDAAERILKLHVNVLDIEESVSA